MDYASKSLDENEESAMASIFEKYAHPYSIDLQLYNSIATNVLLEGRGLVNETGI